MYHDQHPPSLLSDSFTRAVEVVSINLLISNGIKMVTTVSEKKKRVSKKNKSSWRKHVDIKDVDEFLEEKRLEERLGLVHISL